MILDGRSVAHLIHKKLQASLAKLHGKRLPKIVAILTTDNPASHTYVKRKVAACTEIGFSSEVIYIQSATQDTIIQTIQALNMDETVDGILVQLPLPSHIDTISILSHVDPNKDVDGFHPVNMGKLVSGDSSGFYPCTPFGIIKLLKHYQISVESKHVVIIGRSTIVGKPLALMLMQNSVFGNATVTVAHSKTKNLKTIAQSADILVSAIGSAQMITRDYLKSGAVVIDVGINSIFKDNQKKIVGDVVYNDVQPYASAITPVPGGVGPMTIAMLLTNTFLSFCRKMGYEFDVENL